MAAKHKLKLFRMVLPSLVFLAWVLFAVIGGPYFGKIGDLSTTDIGSYLPKNSEASKANDELKKIHSTRALPILVVYSNDGQKLTASDIAAVEKTSDKLADIEGVSGDISPLVQSEDGKAAFMAVPLTANGDFKEMFPEIKQTLNNADLPVSYVLTGPASLAYELQNAFAGIDTTLLFVALGVVFVILLLVYRSPFLPFIVLLSAMAALSVAVFVVYHIVDAGYAQMNGQVQGILFILVIGAATDYSLLYTARYREELINHRKSWQATWAALKSSYEPILAAGGTVTVGLLMMLFSALASNQALGPVGGIGIVLSVLSALTLLPVLLYFFGRFAFWPRQPKYAVEKEDRSYMKNHPVWARIGSFVQKHPRRIWVGCTALLLVGFIGIFQLKAEGVPQTEVVLGKSESREGQKILDAHFPSGSGSPAIIFVNKEYQDEALEAIEKTSGIASVAIAGEGDASSIPVGREEQKLRQKVLDKVSEQRQKQLKKVTAAVSTQMAGYPQPIVDAAVSSATAKIPSAQELADKAYPFKDAKARVIDNKVMYQATLKYPATSFEAIDTIKNLRKNLKAVDAGALVGGTTASQYDVNQSAIRDELLIVPLVLGAITIILMILLRAIIAPLVLLFTTILSFGATLGVAALLFNHVWQFPGADPTVILFAFVFLVALGIDYNIFLMTRVREETGKSGVREGTIKGLVVTGGVITSAGIVLASTFASLYVIPMIFLAQIAFIVTFGVLLDTIIVRTLLVPALTLEIGKPMWWPSKLSRQQKK